MRREWYLGVVAGAAPARVLVTQTGASPQTAADAVKQSLASLPAGPEVPVVSELVELARGRVPGQRDAIG